MSLSSRGISHSKVCQKFPAVLFLLFALSIFRPSDSGKRDLSVCNSRICRETADRLAASINSSVNPCYDFYEFACGQWVEVNPIPEDRSWWSLWSIVRNKLKKQIRSVLEKPFDRKIHSTPEAKKAINLYKSCTDIETRNKLGTRPLLDLLAKVGGWPMVKMSWSSKNYDWIDSYTYLRSRLGSNFIIAMTIDVNSRDTRKKAIHLQTPSFGMGRKELVSPKADKETRRLVQAYKTYIFNSAQLLNAEGVPLENIKKDIEDMFKFESQLAKSTASTDGDDRFSEYRELSLRELQNGFKNVKWNQILNKIFKYAKTDIFDDDYVIMQDSEYYSRVPYIIRSTPKRVVANYIGWRLVLYYGDYTTQNFSDIYFQYQKVSEGLKRKEKMWEFCYETVDNFFDYIIGRLYVDNNFNSRAISDVKKMIQHVRDAVGADINDQRWMDAKTKRKATEKLQSMLSNVGYQSWIKNNTKLAHFYRNVKRVQKSKFFENILELKKLESVRTLKSVKKSVDRRSVYMSGPAVVNAFNYFDLNYIQFPAGILQPPFYTYQAPPSVNFGGIANTIGHEIIHAFDDEGKQYDKNGNLKDWWTDEIELEYNKKAECFVSQYDRYRDDLTGLNINGLNTQGENIADNGGLRVAYRAYRKFVKKYGKHIDETLPGPMAQFSSDQLFFISFASVWCENNRRESMRDTILYGAHCPSRFRVTGTLVNLKEFADAFHCPLGSKMNPRKKCVLW